MLILGCKTINYTQKDLLNTYFQPETEELPHRPFHLKLYPWTLPMHGPLLQPKTYATYALKLTIPPRNIAYETIEKKKLVQFSPSIKILT